jgi:hypothetical protein
MTLAIFGSECAPGILDTRPPVGLDTIQINAAAIDLPRPFGRDRVRSNGLLVCRWYRELGGRLACFWEPDIFPFPQRRPTADTLARIVMLAVSDG